MSGGFSNDVMARWLFESALEAGLPVLASSWEQMSSEEQDTYRWQASHLHSFLEERKFIERPTVRA